MVKVFTYNIQSFTILAKVSQATKVVANQAGDETSRIVDIIESYSPLEQIYALIMSRNLISIDYNTYYIMEYSECRIIKLLLKSNKARYHSFFIHFTNEIQYHLRQPTRKQTFHI